jgi:hypothetical protein
MVVELWAVIPALALMFVAGRKSVTKNKPLQLINKTKYGMNVLVSPDNRIVVIQEAVEDVE